MHDLPCAFLWPEDQRYTQGDDDLVVASGNQSFVPFQLHDVSEIGRGVARNLLDLSRHLLKPEGTALFEVLRPLDDSAPHLGRSSARQPQRVRERYIVTLRKETRDRLLITADVRPQRCTEGVNGLLRSCFDIELPSVAAPLSA